MFPYMMRGVMSLPQLDRVRWIMFPEVRVQTQGALFDDSDSDAELPSIMRVMDLQQEQLARSLGDGHRVIHGVAGSGKTMILGYRAEYLAKAHTATSKPILILCYNEPLAVKLASVMHAKGLADKVHARHFHKWCRDQLVAFGQTLPGQVGRDQYVAELVQRVIRGVDRKQIASGQYQAVLIDEGHDFAPEWLRLVTQMVDPNTNSLLLLYDDAQSIYERTRTKQVSFKSVGVHALLNPLVATARGCVKTLTKIFGQKIDRLERPTSDDRHLGHGFGTPNFSASLDNFEFLHRLAMLLPGLARAVQRQRGVGHFLHAFGAHFGQPQFDGLGFGAGDGLDQAQQAFGGGYVCQVIFAVSRWQFQSVKVCHLLTALLTQALFELVPVFARSLVISLLRQHLHHVNHRKPPGLRVFVVYPANGLTIELSGQDFHGHAPVADVLASRLA
jgi:hypothetical protein